MNSRVRNTIELLKHTAARKASGHPVSYTDDPAWLVNMAINRRAGWPECGRHSVQPIPSGKYPRKADPDTYAHLRLIASEINTPRLTVRSRRLGEWRVFLLARIPERITIEER